MWIRAFLVLLMAGALLYALNNEVEGWCNDSYARSKSKFDRIRDHITDDSYTVPLADRRPTVGVREFYADNDANLTATMLRTRLKFRDQHHVGSVMRDGFHADLPPDAMWKGGVIVVGDDIRRLVQLASIVPSPPPPAPPTPSQ